MILSPSTRRAWIEIFDTIISVQASYVALHPEGVDRNGTLCSVSVQCDVALHPEGVDRNIDCARFK